MKRTSTFYVVVETENQNIQIELGDKTIKNYFSSIDTVDTTPMSIQVEAHNTECRGTVCRAAAVHVPMSGLLKLCKPVRQEWKPDKRENNDRNVN